MSGLVTSARVITAAATIMVFVFGSFVLNGDPTVKQFGIGLAVAVILDATVVRCLLVPALMVMMGKANWYMPALAGPDPAAHQHRGRRVLQGPRRAPGREAGPVLRPRAFRWQLTSKGAGGDLARPLRRPTPSAGRAG